MSDRKIAFYSYDDSEEVLSCDDLDDAVEAGLDRLLGPQMSADDVLRVLPDEIEIFEYARMEIRPSEHHEDLAIEPLLASLDEEYGDPDGEPTIESEKMSTAVFVFIKAIIAEYEPWACEQVSSKMINVREWVDKNRPDWLEEITKNDKERS